MQQKTANDPAGNLPPGSIIDGKFELQQFVAAGGMGFIYRARAVANGRPLALKIMREALRKDPVTSKRFKREAETIRKLFHPNTVSLIDFGESPDGLLYIAMEWLEGEDLADRLHRQGPLEASEAAHVALQVCRGLVEAHGKGIIHRDLKPENIFLHRQRELELVKVLDFGIAKAVSGPVQTQITRLGMVCGTPDFMSPEQARGEALDARSDVYSLGCVLFNLLTGEVPFPAESALKVVLRHLSDSFPSLPPSIPLALRRIIEKAVDKDPAQRFSNARQMAQALAHFLCVDVGIGERNTLDVEQSDVLDVAEAPELASSQDGDFLPDDENASTELAIPALMPLPFEMGDLATSIEIEAASVAPPGSPSVGVQAMAETALAIEPIAPVAQLPSPASSKQKPARALEPASSKLALEESKPRLRLQPQRRMQTVLMDSPPKARLRWWHFAALFGISVALGALIALFRSPEVSAPIEPPPRSAAPAPVVDSPPSEAARLNLLSNVPAEVESTEGRALGSTPLVIESSQAIEAHFVLSSPGHRSVRRWVKVELGEEKDIEVVLQSVDSLR